MEAFTEWTLHVSFSILSLTIFSYLHAAQNGSNIEIIARGIRDTQGFDFDPYNGQIWFTDNGRDYWGNDRPPECVLLSFYYDSTNLIRRINTTAN